MMPDKEATKVMGTSRMAKTIMTGTTMTGMMMTGTKNHDIGSRNEKWEVYDQRRDMLRG